MTDPMKHIIKTIWDYIRFSILGGNQGGKKVVCFLFIHWTSFWILLCPNFKFNKKQLLINFESLAMNLQDNLSQEKYVLTSQTTL